MGGIGYALASLLSYHYFVACWLTKYDTEESEVVLYAALCDYTGIVL